MKTIQSGMAIKDHRLKNSDVKYEFTVRRYTQVQTTTTTCGRCSSDKTRVENKWVHQLCQLVPVRRLRHAYVTRDKLSLAPHV